MAIQSYKEIVAWQKAHELVLVVYKLTQKYPKEEIFGLTSQTRRALVSVASNLVEGFKRKGKAESSHFYNIAQASLEEVRYQLLLAKDLGYIEIDIYNQIEFLANDTAKLTYGWIKNIK
jgi:four helix bundle protein